MEQELAKLNFNATQQLVIAVYSFFTLLLILIAMCVARFTQGAGTLAKIIASIFGVFSVFLLLMSKVTGFFVMKQK